MTENLINIIRALNGGSVLSNQKDKASGVNLYTDKACLYIDENDSKYYYFADLIVENNKSNLGEIEKMTVGNTEPYMAIDPPEASNSYLILFWKVACIDESIYRQIIRLEENEFFFKKYVFYYSEEEYNAFIRWYSSLTETKLSDLIEKIFDENSDFELPHISFLIRLLIKIPFWNITFPKAVLKDYDSIVSAKIDLSRGIGGQAIKELNLTLTQALETDNFTADSIAEVIYKIGMEV